MTQSHDPVATVVITTHDRQELARRALSSALHQTLRDIEVVVVDDGSEPPFVPDAHDGRVRLIRHEHAGGVSAARNAGLAAARGRWITFLDDDDELVPEMLERSIVAASTSSLPEPVAAMSAVAVVGIDGDIAEVLVPAATLRRGEDFFLEGRGAAGRAANSIVAPVDVLRSIDGWDRELESFQHDDLGLRLNAVASIQGIADPLYRMTTHRAGRVSGRTAAIPADMERTLAKHPLAFARHRTAHARYLGRTGYYHLKAGHWSEAIRWTARGVRRNPTDRRTWWFFVASLAGPHVLDADRRLRPRGVTTSFWTLTKRRTRKGLRLAGNHPRAWCAAPIARATRRAITRRVPESIRSRTRAVLLFCVYRSENAAVVAHVVDEARTRGWECRTWALDRPAPALEGCTVGTGPGAKFPLLNELARGLDVDRYDWIVVADDDFLFDNGSVDEFLALAEAAGLDLAQPAHTERSHRENEIARRRALALVRWTTFVEIGPMFAVRRPWTTSVVPFPADHTMGWGMELDWFELSKQGARLGIVDAVAIRHVSPVGRGYAKEEQHRRLKALVEARGLRSFSEIQQTVATWRPWQADPPWSSRSSMVSTNAGTVT